MRGPHLDAATLRKIAVRASVDPRTIKRLLRGAPVRGLPAYRIREALAEEGLGPPPAPLVSLLPEEPRR